MVNHFEKGTKHWNSGDYELALYCFKDAKDYGEHLQHEKPDMRKAYLWNLIGICNYKVAAQSEKNEKLKIREALDCFENASKLINEEPIYWRNYALLLYWNSKGSKKVLNIAKTAIEKSIVQIEKIHPIRHETDLYDIQEKIEYARIKSIDSAKIPKIIKIFSKFDKINTSTLAKQLDMDIEECLDWLINLPEDLGFVISTDEIRINHNKFSENKYRLEDLNTIILKTDVSLVLEPNPILD